MAAADIPTPPWIGPYPETYPRLSNDGLSGFDSEEAAWIVKSLWEHASVGLHANRIIKKADPQEIRAKLKTSAKELGGACFAEMFIDGREFNMAILEGPKGPFVLPAAEIYFDGYEQQPKIVCYRAKWEEESWEYSHTVRKFDIPGKDDALVKRLSSLSLDCWKLFGLSGYARVDFRVDHEGNPWILEVNANPCLSPDAGFAAAAEHVGIPYSQMVQWILDAARNR
jgi:D-alanine-D-alanine ligase